MSGTADAVFVCSPIRLKGTEPAIVLYPPTGSSYLLHRAVYELKRGGTLRICGISFPTLAFRTKPGSFWYVFIEGVNQFYSDAAHRAGKEFVQTITWRDQRYGAERVLTQQDNWPQI